MKKINNSKSINRLLNLIIALVILFESIVSLIGGLVCVNVHIIFLIPTIFVMFLIACIGYNWYIETNNQFDKTFTYKILNEDN